MKRKHQRDELRSVNDRNFAWRNTKEEQIEIKMCLPSENTLSSTYCPCTCQNFDAKCKVVWFPCGNACTYGINKQQKVKVESSSAKNQAASILNWATLSSLSVPDTTELTLSSRLKAHLAPLFCVHGQIILFLLRNDLTCCLRKTIWSRGNRKNV